MKKKIVVSSIFLFFHQFSYSSQPAPYIITFFFRPLPKAQEQKLDKEKIEKAVSKPGKVVKQIINKEFRLYPQSGIYVTYAGYLTHSDLQGQVSFSRKTGDQKLYILVSENIKEVPVNPLNKKTLSGFIISKNAQYRYYLLERKEEPETGIYSWQVSETELPQTDRIPINTIIIIANPKHIIIPIGTFSTIMSENLMLPDIYVSPNIQSAFNIVRFLRIRYYFGPVKYKFNFKPQEYQQRVAN